MKQPRRLQYFRTGQSLRDLRQPLNRMVTELNKRDDPVAGPVGASLGLPPTQTLLLEIRTLNAANLVCNLPGQSLNGSAELYTVELPQTLNESTRGGVVYAYTDINNRTADGSEIQQLTPVYLLADLIVATLVQEGNFWIDMNIDGRQWAKVP